MLRNMLLTLVLLGPVWLFYQSNLQYVRSTFVLFGFSISPNICYKTFLFEYFIRRTMCSYLVFNPRVNLISKIYPLINCFPLQFLFIIITFIMVIDLFCEKTEVDRFNIATPAYLCFWQCLLWDKISKN